jgi:hypothetical protein
MKLYAKLLTAGLLTLAATSASATVITGTLSFGAPGGTNFFEPAFGYVPAGYGNAAGTSVAVGPGVEFGFDDTANLDTADFTATSLTITDFTYPGHSAADFYMTFTSDTVGFFDNLFAGPDTFGSTYSVNGNTLSFMAPGTFSPGTRTATFTFRNQGAVPEPATWAMMLIGFGAVGAGMRHRKPARVLQAA